MFSKAINKEEAFSGCELVHDTHRLALMNAMLHDIEGEIKLADTLSNAGKEMKGYDVVLTNPPSYIDLSHPRHTLISLDKTYNLVIIVHWNYIHKNLSMQLNGCVFLLLVQYFQDKV